MAELGKRTPADGLGLPIEHEHSRLRERSLGAIWQIAPFPQQEAAVSALLGLAFPVPGSVVEGQGKRLIWSGRASAFLVGAAPPEDLGAHAAVVDQSDGWTVLHLEGEDAVAVLARFIALDLREAAFPAGSVARVQLGHHPGMVVRNAAQAFEVWTYRSMASSCVSALAGAMTAVAARRG